jgi:hypothetical protein
VIISDVAPSLMLLSLKKQQKKMFLVHLTANSMRMLPPTGSTKKPRSVIHLLKRSLNKFSHQSSCTGLWNLKLFLHIQAFNSCRLASMLELCDLGSLVNLTLCFSLWWKECDVCTYWLWMRCFLGLCPCRTMGTPFSMNNLYNPGTTSSIFLADIWV